ncbi:type II toxin-antitoxin system toxin ribonuclease VapC11 [Pseudonocardia eucalypti]|uniref:Ribonuclease VapC n=2 Tax=Pseudonocardia eucalypti TaxID=648755 RepID=A0ABP9PVG4_9PSEU
MFLIDSSAWIELLRNTGSRTHLELLRLTREHPSELAITEPVILELLAGPTNHVKLAKVEKLVAGLRLLPVDAEIDYRAGAAAARAARQVGKPVRSNLDCLIAAVAVRTGASLVHQDRDFTLLAEVLPDLRLHSGR